MPTSGWPVSSKFAKKNFGAGKARGFRQGRAQGKAEGRREGRAQGRALGVSTSGVEAVIAILHTRGVKIVDADYMRIIDCRDLDQINSWIRRAVTAKTSEELFR
ncbi:hypothetical protein [Actinomadura macrotermitis]|uniref:Uncharacterized protein n=1 Tax=Actinomadura macrotermitis TaxID=2585200 RepID=A0A7K0BTG8_9ACTN|nr:hypothetical protein [Actinomadura macrotermitis]MQY04488.1 hypothetical protein [Actinomadura macrotermitis]